MLKKGIIALFLLAFTAGCSTDSGQQNKGLEEKINAVIAEKENEEIDLAALTEFSWDQAYLFPPYTDEESMQNDMDVRFQDQSNLAMRDDIYLLVFLHERDVVQYAEVLRQGANFSIGENEYVAPDDAIVKIER